MLAWPAPAHQVASWLAALEFDAAQAARLGPWLRLGHAEIVARAASWLLAAVPAHLPYVVGTTFLLAAVMSGATPRPLAGPALLVAVGAGIAPLVFAHTSLDPLADRRYFATTPPVLSYLESARPPLRIFAEQVITVAREVGIEGKLGGQAKVPGVSGTWRDLTDNVNYMASNLTAQHVIEIGFKPEVVAHIIIEGLIVRRIECRVSRIEICAL